MTAKFFKRAEYREYVRLLVRLHASIADACDEGSEGERLRDEMDTCGRDLSDDEVASLHGISGDMYSLTGPASVPRARTQQAQSDLLVAMHAQRAGDYITALELVRRNRLMIEPSQLSYLRGRILSDAGLDDVAIRFFEHASSLDPGNDDYEFVLLDTLKRFDVARARARAEEILAAESRHPPKLVLKAAEIRFSATREMAPADAASVERQLVPIFESVIVDLESSSNRSGAASLLPLAYALCGFCLQDIAQIDRARQCFDEALQLDPKNDGLLTARGILMYGRDASRAAADFQGAIGLDSQIAWPYLFLAHHCLIQGRYETCLTMCEQALRFPATDRARSNCYEWIAICQAMLGFDPGAVRLSFQHARRLAPENPRIGRNLQAFEDSVQQSTLSSVTWEKGDADEVSQIARAEFQLAA